MIDFKDAIDQIYALATPLGNETVPLHKAAGRVMAMPIHAKGDTPPFDVSAMDGYAIAGNHETYEIIGEIAAGHIGDMPEIHDGQAVRIFTGAPVPRGADRILIQEKCNPRWQSDYGHKPTRSRPIYPQIRTGFSQG